MKILFNLFLLLTVSLFAEVNPNPSKYDDRIGFVTYNPDDIFQINAKDGFVTVIQFDKNERVVVAGTGFNDGWDIQTQFNFLYLKPKAYASKYAEDEEGKTVENTAIVEPYPEDWNTNLFITTNKRMYIADLGLGDKKIHYKISFKYPKQRAEERIKALKKKQAKATNKANHALKIKNNKQLNKDLNRLSVPRNWAYYMNVNSNSEDIKPDFTYDDGTFTYIGFSPHKKFPTAFLKEEEGESILNTHVKTVGKYKVLVIHRMAKMILLRSGKKLVGIFNGAYNENPTPYTKETSNSGIIREVRE